MVKSGKDRKFGDKLLNQCLYLVVRIFKAEEGDASANLHPEWLSAHTCFDNSLLLVVSFTLGEE